MAKTTHTGYKDNVLEPSVEKKTLRELRGVLGPASKELLDKFMLEAETQ